MTLRVLALAAACSAACLTSPAASPAASAAVVPPLVRSQGTQFVDASGAPLLLRGVDVQAGVKSARVAELGANFARIYTSWAAAEPKPGVYSKAYLKALDAQVAYYGAQGINVLLDFHQTGWSSYFGGHGIPAWYYADGRFPAKTGVSDARRAWWTTEAARSQRAYRPFLQMMAARYGAFPNVVGYEVMNEPIAPFPKAQYHEATQLVLRWDAAMRDAIRAVDPSRTVFVMTRTGGDLGLRNADFRVFGDLTGLAIDFHDYYDGLYGDGLTPDGETWDPGYEETHNQYSTHYRGTQANQEQHLLVPVTKARSLGIPLLVGEWGVRNDDSGAGVFQRQMLALFRKYKLSWARWNMGRSVLGLLRADGSFTPSALQIQAELRSPSS
jgi:endoglycosylceramidase